MTLKFSNLAIFKRNRAFTLHIDVVFFQIYFIEQYSGLHLRLSN